MRHSLFVRPSAAFGSKPLRLSAGRRTSPQASLGGGNRVIIPVKPYTVKTGDTLWDIGRWLPVSMTARSYLGE